MNDQDKIAELTAEIARLNETIAWYQGQAGQRIGEAARAGIAGAPASAQSELRSWLSTLEDEALTDTGPQVFTKVRSYLQASGALKSAAPASVPQLAVPQERKPDAWLWRQHGWCVTAHSKHRAITSHVDLCQPPVSTQQSADFISLEPLFTGQSDGQQGMLSIERIVKNAILGNSHPCDDGYLMLLNEDEVTTVAWQVGQAVAAHAPAAPLPVQPESQGELLAYFLRSAYPVDTSIDARGYRWSEAYLDQARAAALAGSAPLPELTSPSTPTDLSKRLRAAVKNGGQFFHEREIIAAADEIERYYGGMLNWKRTAEAKDRASVETAAPGASIGDKQ